MSLMWIVKGGPGSGDKPHHEFHGNQYTDVAGSDAEREDRGAGRSTGAVVIDVMPKNAPAWLRDSGTSSALVASYLSDVHGAILGGGRDEIADAVGLKVKRIPGTGLHPLSVSIESSNDPHVDESPKFKAYAAAIAKILGTPVFFHEPYYQSGGENTHNASEIRMSSDLARSVDFDVIRNQIYRDTGDMSIAKGIVLSRSAKGIRAVNFGPGLTNSQFHDLIYDVMARHYPNATDYLTFSARTEKVTSGANTDAKALAAIQKARKRLEEVNRKWRDRVKSVSWRVGDIR